MTELQSLETDDFGKKIIDTIALQLKSNAPLAEVSKLLKKIDNDLEKQQNQADELQNQREVQCKSEIAAYKKRIAHANSEIEDASQNIGNLNTVISQLESSIANKQKQLKIVKERQVQLTQNWENDKADFLRRKQDHEQVISALDLIIPKLQQIPTSQTVSAKSLLVELSKIGSSNPIAALIQVALSLPQKDLEKIIRKFQELKSHLEASLQDDKTAQVTATQNFNIMLGEIQKVQKNLEDSLEEDQANLELNKSKLTTQQKRLADNEQELKQATEGLQQKTQQCKQWKSQYDKDSADRKKERVVIFKVQEILATRLDTMQGYLKKRVNQI